LSAAKPSKYISGQELARAFFQRGRIDLCAFQTGFVSGDRVGDLACSDDHGDIFGGH